MAVTPNDIESLDGFQNLDDNEDWLNHEPEFAWSAEDLEEFE